MTMPAALLIALNLIGAANGLILAGILFFRRDSRAGTMLALLLVVASLTMVIITLEHAALVPHVLGLYVLEETFTLLSGPLLLHYVMLSLQGRSPSISVYLPPMLYLLATLLEPAAFRQRFGLEMLICIQIAYTLYALSLYGRWVKQFMDQPRRRSSGRFVGYVLLCMVVIHLAQILRYGFSEIGWLRDIVPLVVTAAFYAFMLYALQHSRALHRMVTPLTQPGADPELGRLDHFMQDKQPFLDPDLTLADLASSIGLSSSRLSNLINNHRGLSFYEFLAQYRVQAARALLEDPDEARYSVDGIGRQAGFRSRSAFYKTFKAATGLSPAAYRRHHAESKPAPVRG